VHPTYIFPTESKAVVHARFPNSIKEYADPTGDLTIFFYIAYWKVLHDSFGCIDTSHKCQQMMMQISKTGILSTMPILEEIGTIRQVVFILLTSSGNHTPGSRSYCE